MTTTGVFSGVVTGVKMLRSPREIPAMVAALALGVGLTVTVYSLIAAVLLTPLPYAKPERLVQIWTTSHEESGLRLLPESYQAALAASPSPFRAIASYNSVRQYFRRDPTSAPVQLGGALVSANLFDLLGVRPTLGRTFGQTDSGLRDSLPIVISERLIRAGTVNTPVGELLQLDAASYRLIGIMPEAFWFPDRQTSYWVVLPSLAAPTSGAEVISRSFSAIARLEEGVGRAAAEARANASPSGTGGSTPLGGVRVEAHVDLLSAPVRPALLVLQAASALVLLLVCLNVAWLFAARARRLLPAFGTMRALGATPAQVIASHLVSAVCVAVIAMPCAVAIAWILLEFGMTLESGVFSQTAAPAITWHIATVAVIVTAFASVASCLPGAVTVVRSKESLNEVSRRVTFNRRLERVAMSVQVGLVFAAGAQAVLVALVLLSLSRTNVGIHKTDFVVVSMAFRGSANIDPSAQLDRYKLLIDRLASRGIRAAMANTFPLTDSDSTRTFEPRRSREQRRAMVRTRIVTPEYFRLTGLTATSGRLLSQADAGSNHIVVTNAFGTAVLKRNDDVLGARTGNRGEWTIVGLAPSVRQFSIDEAVTPEAYLLYDDYIATQPNAGSELQRADLLADTPRGVAATISVVRQEIANLLSDADIQSASQMQDLIDLSLGVNRLVAAGSIVFAVVALLLAALGLYAMVSQGLELRRREIGVRLALGATRGRVAFEFARPVAVVYGVGLCLGIGVLLSARSAIQAVMVPPPGVGYPPFAAVVGSTATILLAVLIVACYRPVRSASGTDPAVSLRVE
jgi:putative ABC transport system permease protein